MENKEEVGGTELFDNLVNQAIAKVQPTLEPQDDPVDPEIEAKLAQLTPGEQEIRGDKVETEVKKETPKSDDLDRLTAREAAIAAKERELEVIYKELTKPKAAPKDELGLNDLNKMGETNVPAMLEKLGLDHEYVMDVLIAQ